MRKFVADSDDDGSIASPGRSEVSVGGNSASRVPVIQTAAVEPQQQTGHSASDTSSTELLRRDIRNAHQQLMKSASPAKRPLTADANRISSSGSPTTRRNKRRKTVANGEMASPQERPERRKTLETYGRSKRRMSQPLEVDGSNIPSLRGLNRSSQHVVDNLRPTFAEDNTSFGSKSGAPGKDVSLSNPPWDLPGSMVADFAQHESMAMFSEQSSTIPDNTMTQQRLVDEALSVNEVRPFAGLQLPENPVSSSSSIPWSTYMASIPASTPSGTNVAKPTSPGLPSSGDNPTAIAPLAKSGETTSSGQVVRTPSKTQEPGKNPGSSLAPRSSERIRRTKTHLDTSNALQYQEEPADKLCLTAGLLATTKQSPSINASAELARSVEGSKQSLQESKRVTQPGAELMELGSEDIAVAVPAEQHKSRSTRSKSNRLPDESAQAAVSSSNAVLNSDDVAIGLPKERYKPRPSRSRSTQLIEEKPIDFSVRPEKAAKAKAQRRKTTDASIGQVVTSEAEKIESMMNMGFTRAQAKRALNRSNGDVDRAVDSLVNHPAPSTQDSLADDINVKPRSGQRQGAQGPAARRADHGNLSDNRQAGHDDAKLERTESLAHKAGISNTTVKDVSSDPVIEVQIEIPSKRRKAQADEEDGDELATSPKKQALSEAAKNGSEGGVPAVSKPGSEHSATLSPDDSATLKAVKNPSKRQRSAPSEDHDELNHSEPEESLPKTKRIKSANTDLPDVPTNAEMDAPEPPKRRGRGRPRKEQAVPVPSDTSTGAQPVATNEPEREAQEILSNTTASHRLPSPPSDPPNTPPEPTSLPSVQTPQKAASGSGSGQHSPLSKGKVPYRVGLSRRARIPSLLRTLKK